MNSQCKLCKQEKQLRRSHILPEFMYRNLYDENPRRFYEIHVHTEEPKKNNRRIEQKGIREFLLCQECETKLSKWERYADETLYSKNGGNKTHLANSSITEEGKYFVYEFADFDYPKFKLFLMSIFWRLLITDRLAYIKSEEFMVERLRQAIYSENPLEPDEYGCLLQVIKYSPEQRAVGFILAPYENESRLGQGRSLNQLADGFMYTFFFDHQAVNSFIKGFFLQKNGSMKIWGRYLWTDPVLLEMVKKTFEHLGSYDDITSIKP